MSYFRLFFCPVPVIPALKGRSWEDQEFRGILGDLGSWKLA